MASRSFQRTHESLPSSAWCGACKWTFTVSTPALNAEAYRAAKQHAREKPGHPTSASVTHVHSYVVQS
jgi:hypothetical protein